MNKEVVDLLKPIAETFNVAVKELWGIFVKRYVVKGVSELFTALLIMVIVLLIFNFGGTTWTTIAICSVPIAISILLVYDAIQCIGNPSYFALNNILERIKGGYSRDY